MNSKKWLALFAVTFSLVLVLIGIFNVITDPFGVFGDSVMDWFGYDMTNNPRTAKITYLDKHHEEYDSYIIGCSSTSSFPTEDFGKYLDARFYNMIMYGADMLDVEQMCAYMIENYTVKNLVVNVYIDNGAVYNEESNKYTHCMPAKLDGSSLLSYYSRFLLASPEYGTAKIKALKYNTWLSQYFDIFDEKTGAYDKRRRDIEPISDIDSYLKAYPEFVDYPHGTYLLPAVDDCLESLKKIKQNCDENDVNLIVVTAPVYCEYMANFYEDAVISFYTRLAEVTDYWDFSYSSVSFEPRYFYDRTHFRNNVGHMAAARIFGDDSIYIPDDFGFHVTEENADEYFAHYFSVTTPDAADYTHKLPVLMYHHIAEEAINDMTVSAETFRAQMQAVADAGYTAVTLSDINDYVNHGTPIPEKSVLITFDDGYESNYTYAYPILKELGLHAVIFAVGTNVGKDEYKDTGIKIFPHFGEEEAREMTESGVIEIESHTFDLHGNKNYEQNARENVSQISGESEEEYISVIRADFAKSREYLSSITGKNVTALSYPSGVITDNAARIAVEEGYTVTVSTVWGKHELVMGLPQSLYAMKRYHISNNRTPESLIELLETGNNLE